MNLMKFDKELIFFDFEEASYTSNAYEFNELSLMKI